MHWKSLRTRASSVVCFLEVQFNLLAHSIGLERPNVRELPFVFHAHDCEPELLQALAELISVVEALRRFDDVELTV